MVKKQGEVNPEGPKGEQSRADETPDLRPQVTFAKLLIDYGLKEKAASLIAEHIADTGSDRVFEKPLELLQKLAKFPREIPPTTRRNILEHWFAQNKVPMPEGFGEESEKPAEELRAKYAKGIGEEAKYSVDTDTGRIKVVSQQDKAALTWDEADKLSRNIETKIQEQADKQAKKSTPKVTYVYDDVTDKVRMARENEVGGTLQEAKELKAMAEKSDTKVDQEPQFIQGEGGKWIPNPKAKFTHTDLMLFQMFQKAEAKGEATDPFEYMASQAERIATMRKVFGGDSDSEVKQTLKAIMDYLKEGGAKKGESDDMKALREQIAALNQRIMQKENEELVGMVGALRTEVSQLRKDIAEEKGKGKGKNELDIMSEVVGLFDRRLGAIEQLARGAIGRPPKSLSLAEKEQLTENISSELGHQARIHELAKDLWPGPTEAP